MKGFIKKLLPVVDVLIAPFVLPAAWLLKGVRKAGLHRLPLCRNVLLRVGVLPIRNHYYEPQFLHEARDFTQARPLPGIDWNIKEQLAMLDRLTFADELVGLPTAKPAALEFHLNNGAFESGDAEYWYQLIRATKPRRIIEIGSGHSTLMAKMATSKNRQEDSAYACEHICIEPYEMPWLENTGVQVLRKKVEDVEVSFFSQLEAGDILFVDSSHVIRPRGDVLFEFLQLLPTLHAGVIVHFHDIFSPRNYPHKWLVDELKFWNEQYLLEAFLTHNDSWSIVGALNFLRHSHYDLLKSIAPYLNPQSEPGSIYIKKVR